MPIDRGVNQKPLPLQNRFQLDLTALPVAPTAHTHYRCALFVFFSLCGPVLLSRQESMLLFTGLLFLRAFSLSAPGVLQLFYLEVMWLHTYSDSLLPD